MQEQQFKHRGKKDADEGMKRRVEGGKTEVEEKEEECVREKVLSWDPPAWDFLLLISHPTNTFFFYRNVIFPGSLHIPCEYPSTAHRRPSQTN